MVGRETNQKQAMRQDSAVQPKSEVENSSLGSLYPPGVTVDMGVAAEGCCEITGGEASGGTTEAMGSEGA